ncbi:MAG: nucleotidyltransferase family protein [Gaiellaceae bacterium]
MKLLVLAAGYATRLYPLTLDRPKPLLEIAGRPLLDHLLDRVPAIGAIDETIVVTNAKFAPAFEAWAEGRTEMTVVNDGTTSEADRLGAIGDIGYVLEAHTLEDDLVVVAGDNLFGSDISGFGTRIAEVAAPVLAVYDIGDLAEMPKYNQVQTDPDGRITFFEEKPEDAATTLAGIALYYYPRATLPLIREYLADGNNPDQPGRLIQWLYSRIPVYTWLVPGAWYDIGSHKSLADADAVFSRTA